MGVVTMSSPALEAIVVRWKPDPLMTANPGCASQASTSENARLVKAKSPAVELISATT